MNTCVPLTRSTVDILSLKRITGSSSGIGRQIAIESARHGARLVLHHIGDAGSHQDIQTLRTELADIRRQQNLQDDEQAEMVDIGLDVTELEAGKRYVSWFSKGGFTVAACTPLTQYVGSLVELAVSSFGGIDAVVHNAAICQFVDYGAITRLQLDKHMDVNFSAPFLIGQYITDRMITQGRGGSVVSIASVTATFGSKQLTHYAATKAALLGMTASCATSFGQYGIRFNTVSPGTIETAMNKENLAGTKRAAMESRVPLGRLGRPDDIAKPVVFLLSDMAQYISGQNLIVDGASTLNYQ